MSQTLLNADFCIIGGGLAGTCAAIAAARLGATVVLIQDRSVLGGNASSEIKMHIVGADCHGHRPGARETGLLEELRLEDAVRNAYRCYSQWDLLLYEKVMQEPGITLLLNASCFGCTMTENGTHRSIQSVRVMRPSTEEEFEISARFFADCSGDGGLGAKAGANFRMGREAREEFGETKALAKADQQTLGSSILLTATQYDTPQPFIAPDWVRSFKKGDFKHRPVHSYDYGHWWAEWGGQFNTITDNEKIRHELLRIALGIWNYIKNSGEHPDSANWALTWVGAIPGKRESRRFIGPYVLKENDVESGRIFDDQVAYGGWWLDLHPPEGVDAVEEEPCVQYPVRQLYSIPLRALYSINVENLFFAGRNISATHVAFASTRVMGTCTVMGQAIGTAAAILRKTSGSIAEAATKERIRQIQQTLLREDAFLPGLANEDENDLARKAQITCSSHTECHRPEYVADGITRKLYPEFGPWAGQGNHQWESRQLPAWIELRWDEPQALNEIDLTFCTGLERELILTPSEQLTARTIRGPQPETVKDYDVIADGQPLLEIRGNYLRKRRHRLNRTIRTRTLRVSILATHGLPRARVYEIRAYSHA